MRGRRGLETAESGGTEVSDGRRLIPQAFSMVSLELPLCSIFGLLSLPEVVLVLLLPRRP